MFRKSITNTTHLTGSVLAVLACASFVGCSNNREAMNDQYLPSTTTTSATTQSVAQNEEAAPSAAATLDNTGAVPPAPADETASKTESSSTKKASKHSKGKHKAKKHHHKPSAMLEQPAPSVAADDSYVYDSTSDMDHSTVDEQSSVDANDDIALENEEEATYSGVSTSATTFGETGLSPYAQEPSGRFPIQIGSGQLTGEDRSTTVLDGPSLFQDPSALGRDLIH